ncbi:GD11945 [Drosophila simulans]|uniref:GD11945 n=1 Tax=Drosophila simulans TaxID=7240 RepID=B4NTJ1_DROSI|nr:GD11945 [Drosophila simulans]
MKWQQQLQQQQQQQFLSWLKQQQQEQQQQNKLNSQRLERLEKMVFEMANMLKHGLGIHRLDNSIQPLYHRMEPPKILIGNYCDNNNHCNCNHNNNWNGIVSSLNFVDVSICSY